MRVLTVSNEKGGVGKTTLSLHLALWFAWMMSWRVVVVDGDSQGHVTIGLGEQKAPNMHDLLVREAGWRDSLRYIDPTRYVPGINPEDTKGACFLVPGNKETRSIAGMAEDDMVLYYRLQEIAHMCDLVIIDTGPTPSLFNQIIYMASDAVLVPTVCEAWSMDGLLGSMQTAGRGKARREAMGLGTLDLIGVVPMKFKTSTTEHNNNLVFLQQTYGDLIWEPIRDKIVWSEAANMSCPVWMADPKDTTGAVREFESIARRVAEVFNVTA